MKKLFLFSVLLMAALFSANAFAYHVYIDDPCEQGRPGTAWNASRISDIGAVTLGGDPCPAWFYDPQGLIFGASNPATDRVEGLSIVESNPFRVDESGELFFSMDVYFLTLQASNMRNFGVRIRLNTGNEWDTLYAVREEGKTFPAYSNLNGGTLEIPIGDKYNGKGVVLQIFFYNDPIANDAFLVAFSNIFMASYSPEPSIENELTSIKFAYGDTYEAALNTLNQSATSLTSIEYAYSVNEKAAKKDTVIFSAPLKSRESAAYAFYFDITDADLDTTNRMQIWPIAVNGEAYTAIAGDTLDFTLTVVDEARLDQDYVPMLECFTSATCAPCRQLNPYLNPVLADLKDEGKINVVKYQVNWPDPGDKYYISGNRSRVSYYGVTAAPTLVLEGRERPLEWAASSYNVLMRQLRDKVNTDALNKSLVSIKLNKAQVKPDSTVEIDFDVISHLPGLQNLIVHAMVIEGTTHGNRVSYAETEFHYVNMAFATPASGERFGFTQDKQENFAYTVNMKKTHMEDIGDLQLVIFVQNSTDKYICQSLGFKMGPGDAAVEDGQLAQVSIYPNPASDMVRVAGLESARVEIFDLTGRKVYEKVDADDVLEVSLASFAKGTYVVRIAQKGAAASHKLVVK